MGDNAEELIDPLFPPLADQKPYQVAVRIIEARQLAGMDINPVVTVTIGEQKKKTNSRKSTNSPFYDEYFVFECNMPPAVFFDQVITISCESKKFFSNALLGFFKIDVATVFAEPGHVYYHKWAVLLDPADPQGDAKGYVKCDIFVATVGERIMAPPTIEDAEDDIEDNLLLPEGVDSDRTAAKYMINVYYAEDLPDVSYGATADLRKKVYGTEDLLCPYIRVTFAGHIGKTATKRHTSRPIFQEKITFVEWFPPLVHRIKFQLRDTSEAVMATAYLNLDDLSDDSVEGGFLPTFGPAFLHLYGQLREESDQSKSTLNMGVGVGVAYRGRLLVSLKVKLLDDDPSPATSFLPFGRKKKWKKEKATRVEALKKNELVYKEQLPEKQDFFLFCCIHEACQIDAAFKDHQQMRFELSIGNEGIVSSTGTPLKASSMDNLEALEALSSDQGAMPARRSLSPTMSLAIQRDGNCWMPFGAAKPCLYVISRWQNDCRRLYNCNLLSRLAVKLDKYLNEVEDMCHPGQLGKARKQLRTYVLEVVNDMNYYLTFIQKNLLLAEDLFEDHSTHTKHSPKGGAPLPSLTELDRERSSWLDRKLKNLGAKMRVICNEVSEANVKHALEKIRRAVMFLRRCAREPQEPFPHIFVWLLAGNQRVGYARFPAYKLLASDVREEVGLLCGKLQTFFLKSPHTQTQRDGSGGQLNQGEVTASLWFGLLDQMGTIKEGYLSGVPRGYKNIRPLTDEVPRLPLPPPTLLYEECYDYELRCHLYMARSLVGSDESGLSDPFAVVSFRGNTASTQVVDQSVNPFWDETLVLRGISIYGTPKDIQRDPPIVTVQIFDYDATGQEFIGQFECSCKVKLAKEHYSKPHFPPELRWYKCNRYGEPAGEVLACVELLQVGPEAYFPALPAPVERADGPVIPVPDGIRPSLGTYKLEILFWGLRDLEVPLLSTSFKPRVEVECAGQIVKSSTLEKYKKDPNFNREFKTVEVQLANDPRHRAPLVIRCVDCRNFGRVVLLGVHTVADMDKYMYMDRPPEEEIILDEKDLTINGDLQSLDRQSIRTVGSMVSLASRASRISGIMKRAGSKLSIMSGKESKSTRWKQDAELGELVETDEEGDATGDGKTRARRGSNDPLDEPISAKGGDKSLAAGIMQATDAALDPVEADENKTLLSDGQAGGARLRQKLRGRQKADEEEMDWWSKYSASVVKLEELINAERAKMAAKKMKQVEEKKSKGGKFKNFAMKTAKRAQASSVAAMSGVVMKRGDADKENKRDITTFKFFNDMENMPDYEQFQDRIRTFELKRGKIVQQCVGKFKGQFRLYANDIVPQTLPERWDPFCNLPPSERIQLVVRVYVIKGAHLRPCDAQNGKSDPYLLLTLGKTKFDCSKEHKVATLNPIFGKCFEFQCSLPQEYELTVQVWDWDRLTPNDLIGETKIDIENRYFSRHRATCGLQAKYENTGYNLWRDSLRPTQILSQLCTDYKLEPPIYHKSSVIVNEHKFSMLSDAEKKKLEQKADNATGGDANATPASANDKKNKAGTVHYTREDLALNALLNWHHLPVLGCKLVPEHMESRQLWNPDRPGIEQGRLEMWVDVFPAEQAPVDAPVDVNPREPKCYELRIVVYDTKDCIMDDYNVLEGLAMSDLYVKGWLVKEDSQQTDVHYRSLNGEGNFNWRMIFKFLYVSTQERMLVKRKETIFSLAESEEYLPLRLVLQLWDADVISADDQLGTLELDLNKIPRGQKMARMCTVDRMSNAPKVSLFKQLKMRGWWPFMSKDKHGQVTLAGKVDLELELLTEEEAEARPAGRAREEPQALTEPKRPETSFAWFRNPVNLFKFVIWDTMKWKCLMFLIVLLIVFFILIFIYGFPHFFAAKLLGAA